MVDNAPYLAALADVWREREREREREKEREREERERERERERGRGRERERERERERKTERERTRDPAADQIVRGPSGGCRGDLISATDSGYSKIGSVRSLDACNSCASSDVREPISLPQAVLSNTLQIISCGKLKFWRVFWKAKISSFVLVQKASF